MLRRAKQHFCCAWNLFIVSFVEPCNPCALEKLSLFCSACRGEALFRSMISCAILSALALVDSSPLALSWPQRDMYMIPVSTESDGRTLSDGLLNRGRATPSLYKHVSEVFSSGGLLFTDVVFLGGFTPSPLEFCTCRFLSASRLSAFLFSIWSCTSFMCLMWRFKAATTSSFVGFSLQKFLLWCRFHLRTRARSSSMRMGALSGLRRGGNNPSLAKYGRRNSTFPEGHACNCREGVG